MKRLGGLLLAIFLIGLGVGLGVVIAPDWQAPAVLWDWWRKPVQTSLLRPPADETPTPPTLQAFRDLQAGRAPAPPKEPTRVKSPPRDVSAPPPPPPPAPVERSESAATAALARIVEQIGTSEERSPGKVVQVASYRDARAAEALARRLVREGFEAYVSDKHPSGDLRHRVRVRPAPGQEVTALAAVLEDRGLGVWITTE